MRGKWPRGKVRKRILSHKTDRSTRLPIKGDDTVFLPDELITEVISFSDVKFLMQMRCVCKCWKSIISDPIFVKLHLKRSARNPHLTLYFERSILSRDFGAVPFPVSHLIIENPSTRYSLKDNDCGYVVGSCNGLLCLLGFHSCGGKMWFRLWNPAMHKMSPKLGYFRGGLISIKFKFKFAFGYDNSSETYKVVMLTLDDVKNITSARVLNLCDDVWKPIQNFLAVLLPFCHTHPGVNDGVYLNGTFNWLALRSEFRPHLYDWKNTDVKDFVIVSFDLGTETYTQLMPPCGFDEMSPVEPSICILMDFLCFSNDYKRTDLIIWNMEEFRVEESWTQLIKVSYENLRSIRRGSVDLELSKWLPLHLSDDGDTLILAEKLQDPYRGDRKKEWQAILYNLRDNRAVRTRILKRIQWFSAKVYVESMVPLRPSTMGSPSPIKHHCK